MDPREEQIRNQLAGLAASGASVGGVHPDAVMAARRKLMGGAANGAEAQAQQAMQLQQALGAGAMSDADRQVIGQLMQNPQLAQAAVMQAQMQAQAQAPSSINPAAAQREFQGFADAGPPPPQPALGVQPQQAPPPPPPQPSPYDEQVAAMQAQLGALGSAPAYRFRGG